MVESVAVVEAVAVAEPGAGAEAEAVARVLEVPPSVCARRREHDRRRAQDQHVFDSYVPACDTALPRPTPFTPPQAWA